MIAVAAAGHHVRVRDHVLTASEVQADAKAAANATVPVSTQGCTPG